MFECDSDDGCVVNINDSIIIRDAIPESPSNDLIQSHRDVMDSYIEESKWTDFIRPRTMDEPDRFPRHKKSDNV